MPLHVAQHLNLKIHRHVKKIRLAEGTTQPIGHVYVNLTINGVTNNIKVVILKNFQFTLLMSLNACSAFKLVIDTTTLTARVKSQDISSQQLSQQKKNSNHQQNTRRPKYEVPKDISHNSTKRNTTSGNSTDLSHINSNCQRISMDGVTTTLGPVRHSFSMAAETARQVMELGQKRLIRKSTSLSAAPTTLADQKDGTKASTMDIRRTYQHFQRSIKFNNSAPTKDSSTQQSRETINALTNGSQQ